MDSIKFTKFSARDVVRHSLVQEIVEAYDNFNNSGKVVFYNPPNNQILLNISNDIDEFIAYFSVEKIDVEVSFCTAEQIKDLNYKFRKRILKQMFCLSLLKVLSAFRVLVVVKL